MTEKIFRLSVTDLGDSVVQTGETAPEIVSQYFNHYGNACAHVQKECEKFVAECRMKHTEKCLAGGECNCAVNMGEEANKRIKNYMKKQWRKRE
jgi:hypothetical protein